MFCLFTFPIIFIIFNFKMYHIISQTQQTMQPEGDIDDITITLSDNSDDIITSFNTTTQTQNVTVDTSKLPRLVPTKPKVLMDVASLKAINKILSEEMSLFKENRIVHKSHLDLTLQRRKTWEKATKQKKEKKGNHCLLMRRKRLNVSSKLKRNELAFTGNTTIYLVKQGLSPDIWMTQN